MGCALAQTKGILRSVANPALPQATCPSPRASLCPLQFRLKYSERSSRYIAFVILSATIVAAAIATWLHWHEPEPHHLDLIIPPLCLISYSALLTWLCWSPQAYKHVLWLGLAIGLIALAIPAWFYTIRANLGLETSLVETLPPIITLPIGIIVGIAIFAQPRTAFIISLGGWLLIALPLLSYLLSHPNELNTARGKEMAITLGPVMAIVTLIIPVYRDLESHLSQVAFEKATIQALSERDHLTKLFNRRMAELAIQSSLIESVAKTGIILFDIDNFKSVNDNYGHDLGDAVLAIVAQRCSAVLRQEDILWGGEEFLAIIKGAELAVLQRIADDLRLAIASQPIQSVGTITASFGISVLQADDTLSSVLQRTDKAMYTAKLQGRNRVISAA